MIIVIKLEAQCHPISCHVMPYHAISCHVRQTDVYPELYSTKNTPPNQNHCSIITNNIPHLMFYVVAYYSIGGSKKHSSPRQKTMFPTEGRLILTKKARQEEDQEEVEVEELEELGFIFYSSGRTSPPPARHIQGISIIIYLVRIVLIPSMSRPSLYVCRVTRQPRNYRYL